MMGAYRGSSTLWTTWLKTAARSPNRVILLDATNGFALTARELTAKAETLSGRWNQASRKIIAFALPNGPEWLATFLAIQRAGSAALPLDPALSREARRNAATAMNASMLWDEGAMWKTGRDGPARNFCCVKTSSGTTGDPKPIRCSAGHLLADGKNIIATMGIRRSDRNLAVIPFGHSYGLGNLIMPLIMQGTVLISAAEFTPRQIVSWISKYRATVLPTVPPIFRLICSLEQVPDLKPLRLAISAGAVLPAEIARAFHTKFGIKIHNFYGSSETGGITYDKNGEASLSGRSVGKPLSGVKVLIQRGGRVRVRSKATVQTGGFVLADLAEWTERGELRLKGRADAMANIGGKKVRPGEVERLLRTFEGISDAWVTVIRDGHGRDFLAAAVETKRPLKQIEDALLTHLPSWKLPRKYFCRHHLPRTQRGKLDTRQLAAFLAAPS